MKITYTTHPPKMIIADIDILLAVEGVHPEGVIRLAGVDLDAFQRKPFAFRWGFSVNRRQRFFFGFYSENQILHLDGGVVSLLVDGFGVFRVTQFNFYCHESSLCVGES